MKITESNKLIAEFMGGNYTEDYKKAPSEIPVFAMYATTIEDLNYHSSWSWLMPVVKKVWSCFNEFQYDSEIYYHLTEEIFHPDYSLSEFMGADINSVYKRVVEFIEWYQINKKR